MHRSLRGGCTVAALLLSGALLPLRNTAAQADGGTPTVLPGAVPNVVARGQARLVGPHDPNDQISFAIALPLRDPQGLEQFVHDVNDPSSPHYHQFLTQAQANQLYNPTAAEENLVVSWLQQHGLQVTETYPNHLMVDVQTTTSQIERIFNVSLNDYTATQNGSVVSFYAPDRAPVIDSTLSGVVANVTGLDDLPRFHTGFTNGTAHGTLPYYPQDFANAYDVGPLWNAGYTGAGQHIGITLWTVPPADSTLKAFATKSGASVATQANGRLHVIPVDGGASAAISPDEGEAGMDIEYSGGMAPGATIDYYEAPTDSSGNPTDQGLLDALNIAGTDGNNNLQITNSWGGCEASSASDPFTSTAERIFAANEATGHNYFFSAGDNGSWCNPGNGGQDPYADYPASSPHVTSVGGTRFNGTVGGSYPGESAWSYCATCSSGSPEGTGGGYSGIFSRPSWQTASTLAANGKRGYPDIAADGDPNTGAFVCYGSGGTCSSYLWGGTSLASPLWAGMLAVTNQYLQAQAQPTAGFLAATLSSLGSQSQTYAPFHDVTSGTNGSYNAGSSWDPVSGWGSPDLYNLARDLLPAGSPPPTDPTPTPTTTPSPTPTSTTTPTPTPTTGPTPTKTPTPAPSPTSTPTPPPASGGTSLVSNGSFELGTTGWVTQFSQAHSLLSSQLAHTGSTSAVLCGRNYCSDAVWQTITLPASFSRLTLTYWVYVSSTDTRTCSDSLRPAIRSTSGGTLAITSAVCNGNTGGWVQRSATFTGLSSFHGRNVQAYFRGTTNSISPTTFWIDDISVSAS